METFSPETGLFVIRPTSVWLAIWEQKRFQGNKSITPADVFPEWKRPRVAPAHNLAEAANLVMSGEVNSVRTTFNKIPTKPIWIPRYQDPNIAYLLSFHPAEAVKTANFFAINGEASFLTEWEITATS